TSVEHVLEVIKDAAAGVINGKQFIFPSQQGPYQAGDYKPVLHAIKPYLDFLREIEMPLPDAATTKDLLVSGKTPWAHDQTKRKGLLEEIDANLSMAFPSGEGKSKLAKMFRDLTLEQMNGFISFSRMEEEVPTAHLERNLLIVQAMRRRIEAGEIPTDQKSLEVLVNLAMDDLLGPSGKHVTLLEAMGLKSLQTQAKRGPQPIVN